MRTRKRMHPYVTRDLEHRVVAHCAAKGITVSAFVEGALEARLDGEAKDNEVIKRDLARLGRGSMRHERELAVLTESLGAFVQMWFAFQPEMSEADKPAAERLSGRRYRDFVNYVSEQLATGSGLAADVAQNSPSVAAPGVGAPKTTQASAGHRTPPR